MEIEGHICRPSNDEGISIKRPDGIYLAAGHVAPPTLLGTPEEIEKHLDDLGNELPVRVHAHVVISRDRAQELVQLLVETIAKYDAAAGRPA